MKIRNGNAVEIFHITVLVLLAFVFFFYGIHSYSLKEPDEGRYAEIPREMVELNDYVVPHLDYVRYFEKPPLFYWAVALSYKAFGIHEWSFRFPNAFSAFLCVIALYFGARRWLGRETAFLSSIILMSSLGFFIMARIVTTDMFFTLWLFLSLLFFYGYYREGKPLFIYLFYAALGFATLTKGPAAVILSGGTVFIFLLTERNIGFLKELKWIRGLAVYLAVILPWIIAISMREKEFLYFFVVDQNFLRFLTSKHKRTGSLFYFFPVLFGGMLPWSIFIPRCFIQLWNRKELRLFFIWTIVVFVFFSISKSKLPPYILPVFPPMALIIGSLFHDRWKERGGKPEMASYITIFAVLALSVFLYGSAAFTSYIRTVSAEAQQIMGDMKGFSIGLSVMSFLLLAALILKRISRFSLLFPCLTVFSGVLVVMIMCNSDTIDKLNTTKRLAAIINDRSPSPEYVVNYGGYDETLPFYTKKRVVIAAYTGELEMGSKYEDARDSFMTQAEFTKLFSSDTRVVVVLGKKRLKVLQGLLGDRIKVIGFGSERYLITNY